MTLRASWVLLMTLFCSGAVGAETRDAERVKAWIIASPDGEDVEITLRDGTQLEGKLADTEAARFGLWVAPDATQARYRGIQSVKQWVDYVDVFELRIGGVVPEPLSGSLEYRLRIGDEARVLTSQGDTLKGKVLDFNGEILRLEGRTLSIGSGDVHRIELQENDTLANGALIGFGVGAGLIGLACTQGCDAASAALGVLFWGGAGAGIGALFDSLDKRYTTIYVGPETKNELTIAPVITRDAKGVVVSFRF